MNMQNDTPVWVKAVEKWADYQTRKWVRLSNGSFPDEIGLDWNNDAKKEFASSMDWNICKYCRGPCGCCEEKQQGCYARGSRNTLETITECTYCPVMILKEVHQMRFKEID